MKKNQSGFSAVELLILLVVIGLIGGAGWYVWQSKSKNSSSNNTQTTQNEASKQNSEADNTKTADETANWKSYTRYGVTFKYPTEWGFKANDNTQSTSTDLTSPEFADDGSKGEQITVDEVQFAQSGLTADNFKTKHLDANQNSYSDYKTLTVNGKKAVQFYSGDSRTTVFFLADDKTVTFVLDTFPKRDAASTTYNKVIETVKIN